MKRITYVISAGAFAVLGFLLLGSCDTKQDSQNGTPPVFGTLDYTDTEPAWETVTNSATGITLRYRVRTSAAGDAIQVEMSAETAGYLAVGLNPTSRMQDADFVIGFVAEGEAWVRDDFGTSGTSHSADADVGGTADLYNVTGTESAGMTTIGFAKLLSSGDTKDRELVRGQTYPIIFSRSSSDSFTSVHNARGSGTITIP